jgi:hypothetical protein
MNLKAKAVADVQQAPNAGCDASRQQPMLLRRWRSRRRLHELARDRDAFVADQDTGTGHQLRDLRVALFTERTTQLPQSCHLGTSSIGSGKFVAEVP